MQATIVRWGNSRGIRLPKTLLETVHLSDNDLVDVVADGSQIIIRKAVKKRSHVPLSERLKNWNGTQYKTIAEDDKWLVAESVGDEEW